MKKLAVVFAFASISAMAADMTGYIVDKSCASKAKGMWTNEKCAASCIGRGDPAVFVTEEGKIYQVTNQDKVVAHAGHKVTVSGTMDGDKITVESVKM